jgi:putative addiction module CopG family antidote
VTTLAPGGVRPTASADAIRSIIEAGHYPSENAVIDEALRLLEEREEAVKLAELRRDVADGIEQADRGELSPFDPLATLARSG